MLLTRSNNMKNKTVNNIFGVSQTFASGKRLLLLFILKDEPMSYTTITKNFERLGVSIGSSEVYKHLKKLLDEGFIVKKGSSYIPTLKGLKAVENTVDIINTPPISPELKFSFEKR